MGPEQTDYKAPDPKLQIDNTNINLNFNLNKYIFDIKIKILFFIAETEKSLNKLRSWRAPL